MERLLRLYVIIDTHEYLWEKMRAGSEKGKNFWLYSILSLGAHVQVYLLLISTSRHVFVDREILATSISVSAQNDSQNKTLLLTSVMVSKWTTNATVSMVSTLNLWSLPLHN